MSNNNINDVSKHQRKMEYLYVFTLGIVILNALHYLAGLFKHEYTFPYYKHLDPKSWWLFYPSFFYQLYCLVV
jgi:hypothetical protein